MKKSDGSRLPTSGNAQERKEQQFKMASEQGHTAFACGCPIARAWGATSCLDRFGKEQFRRWHNETYGVTADGSDAKHLDPASSIHSRMWSLKEPLAGPGEKGLDEYGRKWQIKTWKLDASHLGGPGAVKPLHVVVCRRVAWWHGCDGSPGDRPLRPSAWLHLLQICVIWTNRDAGAVGNVRASSHLGGPGAVKPLIGDA